jgi:hypothetical protein
MRNGTKEELNDTNPSFLRVARAGQARLNP